MSPQPVSVGGLRAWESHCPHLAPTRVPSCAGRAGAQEPHSGSGALLPPCKYTQVLYDGSKHTCCFSLFSFLRWGASSHPLAHGLYPYPGSIPILSLGLGHPHPPRCLASNWKIPLCSPELHPQGDVCTRAELGGILHGSHQLPGSTWPSQVPGAPNHHHLHPSPASITCNLPLGFYHGQARSLGCGGSEAKDNDNQGNERWRRNPLETRGETLRVN